LTASTIGQRIRAARRAKRDSNGNRWTQRKLAERANLHEMTISRLELGVYQPSLDSVIAIAAALGVPIVQLLGTEDDELAAGKGAA
jgi:transcriptional regulator with XRE-family HTH domain